MARNDLRALDVVSYPHLNKDSRKSILQRLRNEGMIEDARMNKKNWLTAEQVAKILKQKGF